MCQGTRSVPSRGKNLSAEGAKENLGAEGDKGREVSRLGKNLNAECAKGCEASRLRGNFGGRCEASRLRENSGTGGAKGDEACRLKDKFDTEVTERLEVSCFGDNCRRRSCQEARSVPFWGKFRDTKRPVLERI